MPKTSATIAVLTDEYVDYRELLVDRIAAVLDQAGYGTLCIAGRELDPSPDTSSKHIVCNSIYSDVEQFSLSGVIVLAGAIGSNADQARLTQFTHRFNHLPVVSLGLALEGITSLVLEEAHCMEQLMEHVVAASNKDVFVFVRGLPQDSYSIQREHVFNTTLLNHGYSADNILYVEGNYDPFDTYNGVTELLQQRSDVGAIVAANDVMAVSTMRAINSAGLQVPHDILVTGFDDTSHATQVAPALTTVRQRLTRLATRSAELLLEQIQHRAAGSTSTTRTSVKQEKLSSELIIRGSTGSARQWHEDSSSLNAITLYQRLSESMIGVQAPENADLHQIANQLWLTLTKGTTNIESYLTDLFAANKHAPHIHWWSNLCHQIEAAIRPNLWQSQLSSNWPLVTSTLALIRERVWVISMDQQFEIHRQQTLRTSMQLQMSSSTSLPEIIATLRDWSESAGVVRSFLVRYCNPGFMPDENAELIHVIRDGKAVELEPISFTAKQVLPECMQDELRQGLLVLNPVYAGSSLFGYVLLDPDGLKFHAIDSTAQSIGNAMRNQHLIQQMELQTNHLKQVNAELYQSANFDELTGLSNRMHFHKHLRQSCERALASGQQLAVMFIDLDGFKLVNDTLGHGAGDELLREVAERLKTTVLSMTQDNGSTARLGGDEFTAVIENVESTESVVSVAEKLLHELSQPVYVQGRFVNVSASIGIALCPQDGDNLETLVKHADIAMYRAKESGKNCMVFFAPEMHVVSDTLIELDNDMRQALHTGGICMHYQPRIDLHSGKICAVEALMRWMMPTPEGSQVRTRPDVFIPVAETTGFITQLDTFALNESCRQARAWQLAGTPLLVAVNLSVVQLQQENFVQTVARIISSHQLDPSLLELEITESGVMSDVEKNADKLAELRALGIQLSIDDFGTGYSSLNYLKKLPVNNLKIDKSFINDITSSDGGRSADASIVRSVVALGKSMEFQLIAEGIETQVQHEFIRSLECNQAQGFLYSRPIPAQEISALLTFHQSRSDAA